MVSIGRIDTSLLSRLLGTLLVRIELLQSLAVCLILGNSLSIQLEPRGKAVNYSDQFFRVNCIPLLQHCKHFVRYEGACTIIALEVTALMMFHRYAGSTLLSQYIPHQAYEYPTHIEGCTLYIMARSLL